MDEEIAVLEKEVCQKENQLYQTRREILTIKILNQAQIRDAQ